MLGLIAEVVFAGSADSKAGRWLGYGIWLAVAVAIISVLSGS